MDSLESLFSLRGHLGLVTGASSGLGVECAHALALAGADVVLVARRNDRVTRIADELAKQYGVQAIGIGADVTIEADIDRGSPKRRRRNLATSISSSTMRACRRPAARKISSASLGRCDRGESDRTDDARAAGRAPSHRDQTARPHHQHGFDLRGGRQFGLSAVGLRGDQGGVGESDASARGRMGRHGILVNAIAPGWIPTEATEGGIAKPANKERMEAFTPMKRLGHGRTRFAAP